MYYGSLYASAVSATYYHFLEGIRMHITLNGDAYELIEGSTLSELIARLDLEGKRFAIEVNEEIISRSEHATFLLSEGDSVELVQAIGGG